MIILASSILMIYSIYFIKIIKGIPLIFELEMLKVFAQWIIKKGAPSRASIWGMFLVSIWAEVIYFWGTLFLIHNLVMIIFTSFFICFEIIHMSRVTVGFSQFFYGDYQLPQIFNWRFERISAILFFTHSLMVVVILLFF